MQKYTFIQKYKKKDSNFADISYYMQHNQEFFTINYYVKNKVFLHRRVTITTKKSLYYNNTLL